MMAELTGRIGGYSKGKGGSMHMFSKEKHFLRRPRHCRPPRCRSAPGLAFSDKYKGNDNVTFAYFR